MLKSHLMGRNRTVTDILSLPAVDLGQSNGSARRSSDGEKPTGDRLP